MLSDASSDPPFETGHELAGPRTCRVWARGEVDLETCVELLRVIEQACEQGPHLLLDLREVAFIDSTGVRMLVDLDAQARRDESDLAILPSEAVRRVLRLCGIERRLPLREA